MQAVIVFTADAADDAGNISPVSLPQTVIYQDAAIPDLVVSDASIVTLPHTIPATESMRVSVSVRNAGENVISDVPLRVQVLDPSGAEFYAQTVTIGEIPAHGTRGWLTDLQGFADTGRYTVLAQADPQNVIEETDDLNNLGRGAFTVTPTGDPQISVDAGALVFAPQDDPSGYWTVSNPGPQFDGVVTINVLAPSGRYLDWSTTFTISDLAFGETVGSGFTWPAEVLAGQYRFEAHLSDSLNAPVSIDTAEFAIAALHNFQLSVDTDSNIYTPADSVEITVALDYLQGNVLVENAGLQLEVFDAAGARVWQVEQPLNTMIAGFAANYDFSWQTDAQSLGAYSIEATLILEDDTQGATTEIQVAAADPEISIGGSLGIINNRVAKGTGAEIEVTLTNLGTVELLDIPVTVRVFQDQSLQLIQEYPRVESLDVDGQANWSLTLPTTPLSLESYVLQLSAELPDGQVQILDTDSLAVVDDGNPQVAIVSPEFGSVLSGSIEVLAQAADDWSAIEHVLVQTDTMAPAPMSRESADGYYRYWYSNLPEGPAVVSAVATDGWGNVSDAATTEFTVDNTPPTITISGISDLALVNTPVTPAITVEDLHPDTLSVWLNGNNFSSGQTIVSDGTYQLEVFATDQAGNSSQQSLRFTIDMTPPPLTIVEPVDQSQISEPQVLVRGQSEANAQIVLALDGFNAQTTANGNGEWFVNAVPLAAGANTITAYAEDLAGNRSANVQVIVERVEPRIDALGAIQSTTIEHAGN